MISKHTAAEMLDSFFTRGFNASKCKTLLKLTIPRVKLLRNRREVQIKQMRRDIARLLETGQEASARIRVEHILREEKMMAAQEIVELFCELIAVRVPIIEAQRECPLDLKEAISSVCFAAPRCADLPELQEVQILFAGKYGKEFVHSATELKPECGVNRQLVELLSIRAPTPVVKVTLLEDIAKEHNLDWEPSGSELVKTNEDLLNGSEKPLPEVHRDEAKSTSSAPASDEHTDSDEEFVMVDFHEVSRQRLQSYNGAKSAPEMLPFPADALSEDDEEEPNLSPKMKEIAEDEQFVPFLYPPSSTKTVNDETDLHDVLAAAQAAAESAEHAAAAAKTAASLAQLRITEVEKKEERDFSSSDAENPFYFDKIKSEPEEEEEEEAEVDEENPFAQFNSSSPPEDYMANQQMVDHSYNDGGFDSYLESDYAFLREGGVNQPQRLPSMDEDVYFSYPNLFASQGSK